jgi:hypothetical protein
MEPEARTLVLDRIGIRWDERSILVLGLLMMACPIGMEIAGIRISERYLSGRDLLNQSPIGELIRVRKSVRKRAETEPGFSSLVPGDPLFVGDRVLTGKDATARITLTDGNVVELGPESLIRIEPIRSIGIGGVKRKIKITLESGTVRAAVRNNTAPILVESPKGEVILEATPLPAPIPAPAPAPPASTGMTGDITAGSAAPALEFKSVERHEPETAAPVQELIQQEEKRVRMEPKSLASAAMEVPEPDIRPLLSKLALVVKPTASSIDVLEFPSDPVLNPQLPFSAQKLRLRWKSVGFGLDGKYRVRMVLNGDQKNHEVSDEQLEVPLPASATGTLEFTIQARLKNGETISSKNFRSQWSLPGPVPMLPRHHAVVTPSLLRGKNKKILLSWKTMPTCLGYALELSRERGAWNGSETRYETQENFLAVPLPASGYWKWRVSCRYTEGLEVSSPVMGFTLRPQLGQP